MHAPVGSVTLSGLLEQAHLFGARPGLCGVLVLTAAFFFVSSTVLAQAKPYPPSRIIGGISWSQASKQRYAPGSDIWDSAWASDGAIYAAWGDGFGFNGHSKAEIGFSQLSGSPANRTLVGTDVFYGVSNPPECPGLSPSSVGGKPTGTIALPGTIYSLHSSADDGNIGNCQIVWLARSTDNGTSWTDHVGGLEWPDANGFVPSAVLQYGPGQEGALAPDSAGTPYIFVYGVMTNRPLYTQYLARVPASPTNSIERASSWQYYAGADSQGNPSWSSSSALAQPVWQDTNNGQWLTVTFDKALGRYLAYDAHGRSCGGQSCERSVSLFDAPSPWGPWTTFDYEEDFDNVGCGSNCLGGGVAVSFFMMQKWFSADGLEIWAEYSSVGAYNSLNLIAGTLSLAPGSTVKALVIQTGSPAVLDRLSSSNPGNLEYIDRTDRLTSIPPSYAGVEVIRLASNGSANSSADYVKFTSTVAQNVCVAWPQQDPVPSWLSSWTPTDDKLVGDTTFNIYREAVVAGVVQVPGPAAHDMYLLLVGCPLDSFWRR